jgi:hypothetical protein
MATRITDGQSGVARDVAQSNRGDLSPEAFL